MILAVSIRLDAFSSPQLEVGSRNLGAVARHGLIESAVALHEGERLNFSEVISVVAENSGPGAASDLLELWFSEGSGLSSQIVEEPVSLLDTSELVPDHAEEGPAQETAGNGSLRDASDEEVDVIDAAVDPGKVGCDLSWNLVSNVIEVPSPWKSTDLPHVVVGCNAVISASVDVQTHQVHAKVESWGLEEMVGQILGDEWIELLDS